MYRALSILAAATLLLASKPDPGRVTARRLNRYEYNNTLRDLLAIDFRPADDFPADDSGYGFDNIGDVLHLTLLDQVGVQIESLGDSNGELDA